MLYILRGFLYMYLILINFNNSLMSQALSLTPFHTRGDGGEQSLRVLPDAAQLERDRVLLSPGMDRLPHIGLKNVPVTC